MKISLITVSFNSEETISETFESVKNQAKDGFELEYIHIDGLSNDSTMEIASNYEDIISVSVSEKDTGLYYAMNKGIDLASGDIIGFLNSDDTFISGNTLNNISKPFFNEAVEVVYTNINYVDDKSKLSRKWRNKKRKPFVSGWHPPHPGFYARRQSFMDYGGFDENLTVAADFDLMLRFMDVHKLNSHPLDEVTVNMKLGGESNKSFRNIMKSNYDIQNSFKKYNLKPRLLYTYRRWVSKILQRF